jgi:hypothetical protein
LNYDPYTLDTAILHALTPTIRPVYWATSFFLSICFGDINCSGHQNVGHNLKFNMAKPCKSEYYNNHFLLLVLHASLENVTQNRYVIDMKTELNVIS